MNIHNQRVAMPHLEPLSATAIQNMENKRVRCYIVLLLNDVILICASFLAVNFLYLGDWSASHGVKMVTVLVPVYLWVAVLNGSYNGQVLRDPRSGMLKAMRAFAFAVAAMLIIAYSFKVGDAFSRGVFWSGTLTSVTLIIFGRFTFGRLLPTYLGGVPFSTVVILDRTLLEVGPHDIILNVEEIGFDPQTDDPLLLHNLAKRIAHADRVLVACQDQSVAAWAHVLKSMAVEGEIVAPDVDRIGVIGISNHGNHRTLVVSAGPLHLRDRIVKRVFDIVSSLLALFLLCPVMIGIAIAVRLESPGPVLFRQQRIGRDNTLFMMFKFRSMRNDVCDPSASVLTSRTDSRVTRVGKFIRRNSLDELPQLLNVLRGDMSLVGPRPHALSARAAEQLYWEIDEKYRHRHAVKPGVTGLAQIRGFRGATVSTLDLTNRLSADLEYLSNWSMSRDLWILFRTVFVIRHDNAF